MAGHPYNTIVLLCRLWTWCEVRKYYHYSTSKVDQPFSTEINNLIIHMFRFINPILTTLGQHSVSTTGIQSFLIQLQQYIFFLVKPHTTSKIHMKHEITYLGYHNFSDYWTNYAQYEHKKLSYCRETARQLPTWRGASPSSPLPLHPLWLHLCIWSNLKPATNIRPACRP